MPDAVHVSFRRTDGIRLPPLGVGLWVDRLASAEVLARQLERLGPNHVDILVDLRQSDGLNRLETALVPCGHQQVAIWLYVITPDEQPGPALKQLAYRLNGTGIQPAGLLLTPAAYLASYQPNGDWPTTVSPDALRALGREIWPTMRLGGGFPTYFTELNRCRPNPAAIDFLTHATSPVVHAADDVSVMESLESLSHVFASARALAPNVPYRVTTSAIGAWTNPYGGTLTPNTAGERVTLSDNDPRQRGLFAAAWSLGYMARAIGRVDSLTLSSIDRPFPITDTEQRYPLFDVLRGLAAGAGHEALACVPEDDTIAALGWLATDGSGDVWLANLTAQARDIDIGDAYRAAVFDDGIEPDDIASDEWPLDRLEPRSEPLTLAPYAVARVAVPPAMIDGHST
ncbi:hypothetical protein [Salinisphaera sp. Q1T1-3]|uniref:hypothetical protein n=1 Tax=Salinisphaera sp. Q1T1-3 TaxID=2321229 RepID=UPI000E72635D|nr:hypothetical protein [Salinisphaera sp. Q1T1-3]RJS91868.1 hypothetical protein D3260_14015 [Salinisphaera sp. Q1T1-3]